MSLDAAILPVSNVEELVRALVRALRAFQMYLPNNPMYQRGAQNLQEAFLPVWAVLSEVSFAVTESDLTWEGEVVYSQPNRGESFAFWLYKDGMRSLTLRRGCEEEEVARLLQTISRARQLPADASDDLLTLLWEQEFTRVTYQFAEVIAEPLVLDPQAQAMAAGDAPPEVTRERVRDEVAEPRPAGVVDLEEFDATLYFLDEVEVAELARQVEDEYRRDLRVPSLEILLDLLELQTDPAAHEETVEILDVLLPNLLSRAEFPTVALLLREVRGVLQRVRQIAPETRARLEAIGHRLNEPATITQLLSLLDEATVLPPEADLGEVLSELQAPALGAILAYLPRLVSVQVRTVVGAAAERLAAAHGAALLRLLGSLETDALPGAIQLAARLGNLGAIPMVGELVRHAAPEVRLAAVEALAQFGTPAALAALEPAIEDVERPVRTAAVAAVARRGFGGALRRLESVVQGRSGVPFERAERRAVFEAYAAVAGPPGLEVLREVVLPSGLFRRKSPTEVRTCAVYALGRLRTPEARSLLAQLSNDKELPVRHAASTLLRDWPA